jgi:hypothetical protein
MIGASIVAIDHELDPPLLNPFERETTGLLSADGFKFLS